MSMDVRGLARVAAQQALPRRVTMLTREHGTSIYGGAGVHVRALSDALRDTATVEIMPLARSRRGPAESGADVPPSMLSSAAEEVLDVVNDNIDLAYQLRGGGGVIHCHTWYTFHAGMLAHKLTGRPLVATFHSVERRRPWKRETLEKGYSLTQWLEWSMCREANALIAVSESIRDELIACYDASPGKVHVIPNGVDRAVFQPTTAPEPFIAQGIDPRSGYLLFVGRITRQKGYPELLDALAMLDRPANIVLCAWHPDSDATLSDFVARLEALRTVCPHLNIAWIDRFMSQDQLAAIYSRARLLLVPSIYEPFGMVITEALACGTPVVAFDVNATSRLIADGETGAVVPRGDVVAFAHAVRGLLDDDARLDRMRTAIASRDSTVDSWDAIAERTGKVYDAISA